MLPFRIVKIKKIVKTDSLKGLMINSYRVPPGRYEKVIAKQDLDRPLLRPTFRGDVGDEVRVAFMNLYRNSTGEVVRFNFDVPNDGGSYIGLARWIAISEYAAEVGDVVEMDGSFDAPVLLPPGDGPNGHLYRQGMATFAVNFLTGGRIDLKSQIPSDLALKMPDRNMR